MAYRLTYIALFLFSKLPSFVLYNIGDFARFILYKCLRYRVDIVRENLSFAFPEKTDTERKIIERQFYTNLVDTFVETIRMISMSMKTFDRMVELDITPIKNLIESGKPIQFLSGHQFNWELGNWALGRKLPMPFLGVYMPLKNKTIDKIFLDMRARTGSVMVAVPTFSQQLAEWSNNQYALGLAADQNPAKAGSAFWLNFMNRATPFVTGPEKGAIRNKTAVVFVHLIRIKRGKYTIILQPMTADGSTSQVGELTKMYRNILTESIQARPDNYLWSHRRWKMPFGEHYQRRWIDEAAPMIPKQH
jgi:KDO2-lipid IV(A) lauroyltransferase